MRLSLPDLVPTDFHRPAVSDFQHGLTLENPVSSVVIPTNRRLMNITVLYIGSRNMTDRAAFRAPRGLWEKGKPAC